jgi:hypothetical protein
MPTWKKLTDEFENRVDVNMDNVAYITAYDEQRTEINFVGGSKPLIVKGTVSEVQDGKVSSGPLNI